MPPAKIRVALLPQLHAHGKAFDVLDITEDVCTRASLNTYVGITTARPQLVLFARVRADNMELLHALTECQARAVIFVQGMYIAFKYVPDNAELESTFPNLLGEARCDQCGKCANEDASVCMTCKTMLCRTCRPEGHGGFRCSVCAGDIAKVRRAPSGPSDRALVTERW